MQEAMQIYRICIYVGGQSFFQAVQPPLPPIRDPTGTQATPPPHLIDKESTLRGMREKE